eukprot:scaffold102028_cov28-Tisochrysis_lutea.AAC.4
MGKAGRRQRVGGFRLGAPLRRRGYGRARAPDPKMSGEVVLLPAPAGRAGARKRQGARSQRRRIGSFSVAGPRRPRAGGSTAPSVRVGSVCRGAARNAAMRGRRVLRSRVQDHRRTCYGVEVWPAPIWDQASSTEPSAGQKASTVPGQHKDSQRRP